MVSALASAILRTLQRRVRDWRALHGPDKEVFFEQEHVAGREGAIDFTECTSLRVTIGGRVFAHLLFQIHLELQQVAVSVARVQRDVRGARCRASAGALGAWRRPQRVAER
jgi:hypothetical protein